MLLLEYEAKSLSAGICAQSRGFGEVEVGHDWCGCDRVLDFLKCRLKFFRPGELVLSAE